MFCSAKLNAPLSAATLSPLAEPISLIRLVFILFRKIGVFDFAEQNSKHPNFLQVEAISRSCKLRHLQLLDLGADLIAGKWSGLCFAQQN